MSGNQKYTHLSFGQYGIPNLARTPTITCYLTLQNARVTTSTVSDLLRKNLLGGGGKITPHPPTQISVKVNIGS